MKKLRQILALTFITSVMTFASTNTHTAQNEYSRLSTVALEQQVEILSLSGDLPFEMGLELIKRWQHN